VIRSAAEIRDDTPGARPSGRSSTVLVLVAAVAAATVFVFLTAEVWHSQGSVSWEWPIIWRANLHPPPGAGAWIALFDPAPFALITIAIAAAALRQRRVQLAIAGTAGCLLATIAAEHVLKPIVERRREFHRHQFFHPNVHLGTLTFPSGHVAAAAACAAFAWFVIGRRHPAIFLVFVVPVVVAWAEIASDGHYPADTIAGFILGVFAVCATVLATARLTARRAGAES
jgi:membrane-associated phospholipid phosphatase